VHMEAEYTCLWKVASGCNRGQARQETTSTARLGRASFQLSWRGKGGAARYKQETSESSRDIRDIT